MARKKQLGATPDGNGHAASAAELIDLTLSDDAAGSQSSSSSDDSSAEGSEAATAITAKPLASGGAKVNSAVNSNADGDAPAGLVGPPRTRQDDEPEHPTLDSPKLATSPTKASRARSPKPPKQGHSRRSPTKAKTKPEVGGNGAADAHAGPVKPAENSPGMPTPLYPAALSRIA